MKTMRICLPAANLWGSSKKSKALISWKRGVIERADESEDRRGAHKTRGKGKPMSPFFQWGFVDEGAGKKDMYLKFTSPDSWLIVGKGKKRTSFDWLRY